VAQNARIRRAHSTALDAVTAARELFEGLAQPDPGLVVFFCSAAFDLDLLAREIGRRFAGTNVIGCTTAGEITPAGYMDGSITGFSIAGADCCAVTELIPDISSLRIPRGPATVDALIAALADRGQAVDPANTFALLLIDGMGTTEEMVLAAVHRRLGPVPLFGGSAGDDMRLEKTHVYHAGRFHSDAALLSLVKIRFPFRIFRHQHFSGSDTRLVVTGADPARRIVTELNAEPAGPEYARIVGIDYRDLTPMVFAEFPLMVRVGGDYYVRSIQRLGDDGSLTFFCAIDEGVVLTLGRHEDMLESLRRFFRGVRQDIGEPLLVIGFDCVLRTLEAENRQIKHLVSRLLSDHNVIGFSTYGEQFAGMHVNQTFTGAYFGRPAEG
jgi:hypothetical protein